MTHPRRPRAASRVPPGRRARRKAELRTRLLRAALDLFARQGFFDTTVEQITEAADVGKGTFFNYFPTKEHALAGFGEMQVARIEAALTAAREHPQPVEKVFHRLIYSLAEEPGRSQALVRNLLAANLLSEPVRHLFRRRLAHGRRRLAQLFLHGQQRGEIRRNHSSAELARLFQQFFIGMLVLWAVQPASPLIGRLEPTFNLFWSAIAAQRGARKS